MKAKTFVPTEDYETTLFAQWLEESGYLFSHLAQNTFTRSWSVKQKLTRNGVKKGVPDFLLCLKRGGVMFVELKRTKGGKVSPEQKIWLEQLNAAGAIAVVAKGFEQAKQEVLAAEGWKC